MHPRVLSEVLGRPLGDPLSETLQTSQNPSGPLPLNLLPLEAAPTLGKQWTLPPS